MAMKVATFNGCRVYNLSSGKTMPQWLSQTKKRALLKDEDYRRRLELIQDFEMTTASHCIKMTNDGEHIIVTGTYPPLVRCYTTSDMAMKFQRGLTCDVVAMETLSDDFSKMVFLQSDRTLSFHAPYGAHYSLRVPKFGRDLKYNWDNCDLYVAASGEELYRINLETGQFKEPFLLSYSGCNKVSINPCHNLVACGGESALCEFWDARSRRAITRICVDQRNQESGSSVTALKFDTDGLTLGVGTSSGSVVLYDIRSSRPLHEKEHQYGLPIVDVTFHNSSRHVISTDKKIIKIWERDEPHTGRILTNIETPADVNNLLSVSDKRGETGLLMATGEQSRVMTYFVPQLGPAPRWCSFLEALTEELEETAGLDGQTGGQQAYEDFKFLTRQEVDELGAAGLIGTPMLRGYMHGFFIDMKLYSKLRAVSKPFEYEEHRKKKIRDKIEAARQSRITAVKRLPKVNKNLAEKLMRGGAADSKSDTKAGLVDDRFASLFEREEFQQDEEAEEFRLRNPTRSAAAGGAAGSRRRRGGAGGDDSDNDELDDLYSPLPSMNSSSRTSNNNKNNYDEDEDEESGGDDDFYSEEEDESDIEQVSARKQRSSQHSDSEEEGERSRRNNKKRGRTEDSSSEGQISRFTQRMLSKAAQAAADKNNHNGKKRMSSSGSSDARKAPRMFEVSEGVSAASAMFGHSADSLQQRRQQKQLSRVPISERLRQEEQFPGQSKAAQRARDKIRYVKTAEEGLVRELSYVPVNDNKKSSSSGTTGSGSGSSSSSNKRVEQFEGKNKHHMRNGGRGGVGGSGGGRGGGRGGARSGGRRR